MEIVRYSAMEKITTKRAIDALRLLVVCFFLTGFLQEVPHAVAAQEASLPTGYVEGQACTDCHESLTKQRFVHPALEDGCDSCHFEEGPHEFEAFESDPDGCLMCHDDGQHNWDHADGSADCQDCHDPHGSRYKPILKLPPRELCQGCHELALDESMTSRHAPVSEGRCLVCHSPHLVDSDPLLRRPVSALCANCHAQITDPRNGLAGAHVRIDEKNGCPQCHDPHEADHEKLLKLPYSSAAHTEDLERDAQLCFTCHEPAALMNDASTGFRDDAGQSLHRIHLEASGLGRNCRACHRLHLSGENHLLGLGFQMGAWRAPGGYEIQGSRAACFPACHEARTYPLPDFEND